MKPQPPLLPQVAFSILLALSLKPRHGYEIMQQVEQDSAGKVNLGPGALYGTIKQLSEQRLIEETNEGITSRRRYYRLTDRGRQRLTAELSYFKTTLDIAQTRQLLELRGELT